MSQHLLRYRVLDNKSENQLQNVFNEMCLTNRASASGLVSICIKVRLLTRAVRWRFAGHNSDFAN